MATVKTNHMVSLWSVRRISILLTIIALVLWSYSITQAKLNIGFYGLIHSFPITFFIALALLTIASAILWVSPQNHGRLLFLQLCVLVASLWLVPLLIGGSPGAAVWSYHFSGFAEYIVREGHLNQQIFNHHNWPSAVILNASLTNILGLQYPMSMVRWVPLGFNLAFLPFLYLFFKNTLGENRRNHCWAGLWLFQLGNWMTASYFSSMSMGYILFFFMLALLAKWISKQGLQSVGERTMNILILGCLTITHLLTSLVTLVALAMLQIAKKIKASTLIILGVVFVMTWMIYVTTSFFEASLPYFIDTVLKFAILMSIRAEGVLGVVGNDSYQAVARVRLLTLILFLIIAFAGFVYSRKTRQNTYTDNAILAMALAPVIVGIILGMSYGIELLGRIWLFTLPAIAYFGVKLLHSKFMAASLCALLLISPPLFFVSHYGGHIVDHLPASQFAAEDFFQNHTTGGEIIAYGILGKTRNSEKYHWVIFDRLREDDTLLRQPSAFPPRYVTTGLLERNRMNYRYNDPAFVTNIQTSLEHDGDYNLIYVNPDLSLYIYEGQEE